TSHFFVSDFGQVFGAVNPVTLALRLGPRHCGQSSARDGPGPVPRTAAASASRSTAARPRPLTTHSMQILMTELLRANEAEATSAGRGERRLSLWSFWRQTAAPEKAALLAGRARPVAGSGDRSWVVAPRGPLVLYGMAPLRQRLAIESLAASPK